ncbi:MAG: Type II secretion system protein F [candidate division WS2 bacterium]|uniref:Type II secretion system protein F n=1 Tax=Psychracetigena formicireducens TaxID=2986056 RepID=A0A9E2BGS8_PSYF1|nr:Type II secretion system protein F [Candidatus Psychracetigena formicireducens]MBT9144622.1 Type II secretion system protein F [Candidatus Psychracetigena formicireducens]MBT9149888.1 Type II secretion system protein F [Candidatus Psychracetigena formicireducens]
MPNFKYRAINTTGKKVEGILEAESSSQAAKMIGSDLSIISIIPIGSRTTISEGFKIGNSLNIFKPRVSLKDLSLYARQLAVLLKATPLINALSTLTNQLESPYLKKITREVQADVSKGLFLSVALSRQKDVFSPFFINVVKSGEATGKLTDSLERLSSFLEKDVKLRSKIKSALTYPIIVVTAALIMVVGLTTFVIPGFAALLIEVGVDLPLPTQIVMTFSKALTTYWYIALAFILVALYLLRRYLKTETGRKSKDRLMLKLFLVGPLFRKSVYSQFARTLSLLLEGGTTLIDALKVLQDVIGNAVYEDDIKNIRLELERGKTLKNALSRSGLYPPLFLGLVGSGEESGALSEVLKKVADFYDDEIEYTIASITAAIEPIMLIFLGGMIAFLVLTMFLPLFSLMGGLQ